ncbi:putative K domain superfamily, prokaryotic type protein [Helianthus annuus]|nr:putative K domain superfamily, prokaryotic type protein [Helianthus annuus]
MIQLCRIMICIVIGNMGQKINPIGFRLGTTQGHHSLWFAQPKIILRVCKKIKK